MLPGIRLLFATFVLSASVLIFGLGAAALLRSAHEEFTGVPAWRAAQQPMAPAFDAGPTLALLRADPPTPKQTEVARREAPKVASIDAPAIADKKQVDGEKTASEDIKKSDEVSKPRVRRAKRPRAVRFARGKTIRHWSASSPNTIQPLTTDNSTLGLDTPNQSALSGTGRNRRSAANSPF